MQQIRWPASPDAGKEERKHERGYTLARSKTLLATSTSAKHGVKCLLRGYLGSSTWRNSEMQVPYTRTYTFCTSNTLAAMVFRLFFNIVVSVYRAHSFVCVLEDPRPLRHTYTNQATDFPRRPHG